MTVTTKKRRARKSYAARTGMNARSSTILAGAMFEKPAFFEDDNGNRIRVWKQDELMRWTNAELQSCLRNRVAIEANEMLGTVPPPAVKYCVSKGWLVPNASQTLFFITRRAALELDLPLSFKGGENHGRKIHFAVEAPPRKAPKK